MRMKAGCWKLDLSCVGSGSSGYVGAETEHVAGKAGRAAIITADLKPQDSSPVKLDQVFALQPLDEVGRN